MYTNSHNDIIILFTGQELVFSARHRNKTILGEIVANLYDFV